MFPRTLRLDALSLLPIITSLPVLCWRNRLSPAAFSARFPSICRTNNLPLVVPPMFTDPWTVRVRSGEVVPIPTLPPFARRETLCVSLNPIWRSLLVAPLTLLISLSFIIVSCILAFPATWSASVGAIPIPRFPAAVNLILSLP